MTGRLLPSGEQAVLVELDTLEGVRTKDAVVALLIALDTDQSHCFHAVMQGCRGLSNSRAESDGLDELLPANCSNFSF